MLGSVLSGRISSWEVVESIGSQITGNVVVGFVGNTTFEDIKKLMNCLPTDKSVTGFFTKNQTFDAVDFMVDRSVAFKRGKKDYYIIYRPDMLCSIFMPEKNVTGIGCVLVLI